MYVCVCVYPYIDTYTLPHPAISVVFCCFFFMCMFAYVNNSREDYLAHKANGPAPIVKEADPLRLGKKELLMVSRGRENNGDPS